MRKIIFLTAFAVGLWMNSFGQAVIQMNISQPDPLVAYAGKDTLVCKGHAVPLGGNPTATGGMNEYLYLWSPPDGLDDPTAANPTAILEESKAYMVSVTDRNGCQAVSFVNVYVDQCLGTNPINLESTIAIFPNPSDGTFNLKGINTLPFGIKQIELINPLGQIVYQKQFGTAELTQDLVLDTQVHDPGIYFLKIELPDQVISKRLIIR